MSRFEVPAAVTELQAHIESLVDEEHALWHAAEARGLDPRQHERLGFIQSELDSYWDALRRRRVNPRGPLYPANVPTPPNEFEGPEPSTPFEDHGPSPSPHR